MTKSAPTIKRALMLSGGGGRGAYQVGVWRRLQEIGWQPDMVCGTPIGSINGAAKTAWGMGSIPDLDRQHIRQRIGAGCDDATGQLTGFLQQAKGEQPSI